MPRFHFNVYDGIALPDHAGRELEDWHTARQEALRFVGEIIQDRSTRLALGEGWRMEVTDASGSVLFRLDFSVPETPLAERGNGKPPARHDA